jgi:hypothetical protein
MEKLNNKMSVRKVLVPNIANHSSILIDVAGMFLKFSFIKFRFLVDRNNKYSAYNTFLVITFIRYAQGRKIIKPIKKKIFGSQ